MTLDQIVEDDEFPECQRLCTQSLTTDLNHVTDMKGMHTWDLLMHNVLSIS